MLLGTSLVVAGCAADSQDVAEPTTLGATHTTFDTRPQPLAETPPGVTALAMAIDTLGGEPRLDHANVVSALHALADAVETIAVKRPEHVAAIRVSAERLESSPPSSTVHADLVRRALTDAYVALASASPRDRLELSEYLAAVQMLPRATSAIDPDRGLLEQYPQVAAALQAAQAAIEVALGIARS